MRKVKRLAVPMLLLGAMLLMLFPVSAQAEPVVDEEALDRYLQALRTDLVSRRDSAFRVLLDLQGAEGKAFWPLKNEYDQELAALGDTRKKLMTEFVKARANLTAETAGEIANRAFEYQHARNALHRKYFKKMSEEVSTVIAVQFVQLQGQFETLGDVKLASAIPLASAGEVDSGAQAEMLEEQLEAMKSDLTPKRDAALAQIVAVEESKKGEFRSLKKSYDKESGKIAKARRQLLADYEKVHTSLTGEMAGELADRVFRLEDDRIALQKKYFELMSGQISAVAAVQFLQVQSRFETMVDLQAATAVPLAVR